MTLQNTPVSSWEALGRVDTINPDTWVTLSAFELTAADVQSLARAAAEEILGHEGGEGHKPPRADIAKMKEAYRLFQNSADGPQSPDQAKWKNEYELNDRERGLIGMYLMTFQNGSMRGDKDKVFDWVSQYASTQAHLDMTGHPAMEHFIEATPEGKAMVGAALKKYEAANWPTLYKTIESSIKKLERTAPESYKLWPWMVKQMKADFQEHLLYRNEPAGPKPEYGARPLPNADHMIDIVGAGGKALQTMRENNEIPTNFDVNKMTFDEFDNWYQGWKNENRASLAAGETVYKFDDGYTIQKLKTPENLQYEGDEMGHCVGDYSQPVEAGDTAIYSLRDPKGKPKVTMEIEAQYGEPDAMGIHPFLHPDSHEPADATQSEDNDPQHITFDIVQIMGGKKEDPRRPGQTMGNSTPRPEDQRKIKEWLDTLRAKGWQFQRSNGFHHPWDDKRSEDNDYWNLVEASELDDWYDAYKENPKAFTTGGEDAYGMTEGRIPTYSYDWNKLINKAVWALTSPQDRSAWYTNRWEELAQATYHAYMLDIDSKHLTPEQREKTKNDFELTRNNVELELHEQISDNIHNYVPPDQIIDHAEEIAEAQGRELSEEARENIYSLQDEYPDIYQEAYDKTYEEEEEALAGNANKYLGYLYMLIEHHGTMNPDELPDPNERHGGLVGHDELHKMNTDKWEKAMAERQPQPQTEQMPGTFSAWEAASPYQIRPISEADNLWFDEDGEQHPRYRPSWQQPEQGDKQTQDGPAWDTFLDKKGRQAEGFVAYHGGQPVGSLTYVDEGDKHMIGTAYVHPNHREQGLFNRLVQPLRASGKPIDAYVWNNPWLQQKVRSWRS